MEKVQDASIENEGYVLGELLHIIFKNEAEHFSIAKIKIHQTNEDYDEKEVVIKGYFSDLLEHTPYYFYGQFEKHPKFGLQYRIDKYKMHIPDTVEGLISYLSSDLFYGIGKRTAKKIVEKLGENAITKILNNPKSLDKVPGLKKETREQLVSKLQENQGFEQVVLYLSKYRIGLKLAQKIYAVYKEEAIPILEKDPYQLVFDIEGFGFQSADMIAREQGLARTHPNRIGAGCMYVLQNAIQEGHVYLPLEVCIISVLRLLSIDHEITNDKIMERLEKLNEEKKVIIQNGNVYLPSLYYAEDGFSSSVKRLLEKPVDTKVPMAELMKIIGEIEEKEILNYGKEQFAAINQAIHSKMMILTGGPGTGKTTVIKGILQVYSKIHQLSLDIKDYQKKEDFPFILTAPTGRAAKRLSESTGLLAVTIHRLLGWDGVDNFEKNEHAPLNGKLLIIDEFSMVDIWLANQLFKAVPKDMQVLIVGDEDQLPSVGPGQVLSDLLGSEKIPYVQLQEVYRQKEGSKIIHLAHEIKNETCSYQSLQNDKGFSFIQSDEQQMIQVITQIFKKAIDKGIDVKDIQVLAPMYRTKAGINEINRHLQQLINPKTSRKREVKVNDIVYRVGDKVLQLVNQPEDGVYNGDIGEIVAIFKASENVDNVEQIVISFDEKEVVYERQSYENIMHAYCISIHKSQGSEFPIVIVPVLRSYHRMLRKNLLYTAITRSKEALIICGEKNAFLRGVLTKDTNKRYTTLRQFLHDKINETPEQLSTEDEIERELSPYDFM